MDLIVSVPDICLSFYFMYVLIVSISVFCVAKFRS